MAYSCSRSAHVSVQHQNKYNLERVRTQMSASTDLGRKRSFNSDSPACDRREAGGGAGGSMARPQERQQTHEERDRGQEGNNSPACDSPTPPDGSVAPPKRARASRFGPKVYSNSTHEDKIRSAEEPAHEPSQEDIMAVPHRAANPGGPRGDGPLARRFLYRDLTRFPLHLYAI